MSLHSAPYSSRNNPPHKRGSVTTGRGARTSVLHLTPALEIGTEAREVLDLAIQTHRAGWRPLIASAGGALVLEAERAAVRHTRMPLNRGNTFARWRVRAQLEALVQSERPSLAHVHGFAVLPHALALSTAHRVPLLIDLTDPVATVTPAMKRLVHEAAQHGARFRVPSEFMARHLRHDFALTTDLLYRVPPGIDLAWYDSVRVTPERLHKLSALWRLPENATVIVMATPMAPGYGHDVLLDALTRLKRDDIFVVLVGDDRIAPGTRAAIERKVTALNLEGKVILPDVCADWAAACWLASLIVATNNAPRGQALELLAAQAIGRPVIITDCGAHSEMALSGETAWVVPTDNAEVLAQALTEAIGMNMAQRIDLAIRTRDFVAETFPYETWRDAMFQLYDMLLAQPINAPSRGARSA